MLSNSIYRPGVFQAESYTAARRNGLGGRGLPAAHHPCCHLARMHWQWCGSGRRITRSQAQQRMELHDRWVLTERMNTLKGPNRRANRNVCACAVAGQWCTAAGCSLSCGLDDVTPEPCRSAVLHFTVLRHSELQRCGGPHRRSALKGQRGTNPTGLPRAAVIHQQRQVRQQAKHQPRSQRRLVVQVDVHRLQGQHGEQGHLPHVAPLHRRRALVHQGAALECSAHRRGHLRRGEQSHRWAVQLCIRRRDESEYYLPEL